jgi:hypothetical protein
VFEDRVQRALGKLGVPGREDLAELSRRVEGLTAELRRQNGSAAPKSRASRTATTARKAKPVAKAGKRARKTAS